MSNTPNTGGAAFPHVVYSSNVHPNGKDELPTFGSHGTDGMTLRDYFAGQALAGIASQYHEHWAPERVGQVCYELADSLLAARAALAAAGA